MPSLGGFKAHSDNRKEVRKVTLWHTESSITVSHEFINGDTPKNICIVKLEIAGAAPSDDNAFYTRSGNVRGSFDGGARENGGGGRANVEPLGASHSSDRCLKP